MNKHELTAITAELPKRPAPPAGMPAVARKSWKSIVSDYRPGHFTQANLILLEQLCRAQALVSECDKRISKEGLLLDGRAHPLIQVRAQAWGAIRNCATKLRLAISATLRADSAAARPDEHAGKRKPWEHRA